MHCFISFMFVIFKVEISSLLLAKVFLSLTENHDSSASDSSLCLYLPVVGLVQWNHILEAGQSYLLLFLCLWRASSMMHLLDILSVEWGLSSVFFFPLTLRLPFNCLVDLVVKTSGSRAVDPGFDSDFVCGEFFRLSHTSDLKKWHSSGYPARLLAGSVLGLISLVVSVYYDWVTYKIWSAICISVWQHVKLSEKIRLMEYASMLLGR